MTSPEVIKAEHRWEQSRPDDGLVLRVCSREVPVGFGAETKRGPWNLDHAWFTRKEARQFLSAEPKVGVTHALPAALVQRIARFHLVDNI